MKSKHTHSCLTCGHTCRRACVDLQEASSSTAREEPQAGELEGRRRCRRVAMGARSPFAVCVVSKFEGKK